MKLITLVFLSVNLLFAVELEQGIKVVGTCKQKVKPDMVSLSFMVETLKQSVKESTDFANKEYNALLAKIKSLKLKNAQFETYEYNTSPHRVYENKKHILKGYKTRIGLKVSTSEMDKAGQVLQLGSEMGQNFIDGPFPFISDEKFKRHYEKCLVVASKDAQDKAQVLAKSLGVSMGKAFNINEVSLTRPQLRPELGMLGAMAKSNSSAPANIEFGKSDIVMQLEVYFTIN